MGISMVYFWDTVETINRAECDGFSHFDTGHIFWLVLFLCVAAVSSFVYIRADAGRQIIRYAFALMMIADEILKYVIIGLDGVSVIGYLPMQLCSISIIIAILHAFARSTGGVFDRYAGNFLYLVGLPAGLSALLFPSWTALPAFANLMSIHSFTVHIMLVTYIVMMICAKEIRPEVKTAPVVICVLIAMALSVYLFDISFGVNYMYLVHISPASPLAPFEALGDYRIGYVVILAALVLVMYGVPWLLRKRRAA